MNFGNNIEKMAFEKGEWPVVEILPSSTDGVQIIYMGKPPHSYARYSEPGWIIKMIIISQYSPKPGYQVQLIETRYARQIAPDGTNLPLCWEMRNDVEYVYMP